MATGPLHQSCVHTHNMRTCTPHRHMWGSHLCTPPPPRPRHRSHAMVCQTCQDHTTTCTLSLYTRWRVWDPPPHCICFWCYHADTRHVLVTHYTTTQVQHSVDEGSDITRVCEPSADTTTAFLQSVKKLMLTYIKSYTFQAVCSFFDRLSGCTLSAGLKIFLHKGR